jgi:hypothetical protein
MKNLLMSLGLASVCTIGFANTGFSGTVAEATIVDLTWLDGCTFMIRLDNDDLLEAEIPTELQVDGLRVSIDYTPEARATSCIAGETVLLTSIKQLN